MTGLTPSGGERGGPHLETVEVLVRCWEGEVAVHVDRLTQDRVFRQSDRHLSCTRLLCKTSHTTKCIFLFLFTNAEFM